MRQPPSTYCTFWKACSEGNFLWFISCNSLHSSQLDSKGGQGTVEFLWRSQIIIIRLCRVFINHRGVNSYLKLGGQVVMRRAAAARWRAPAILPNPGWVIAHSAYPPFTPLNQVGASLPKLCHKILGYASYEKVSRFSGSRKFLSHWKP